MISRKYPSTRLRRLRQSESIIDLTSECAVTKNDLIQPVFVKEGLSDKEPIESMPGIFRFGEDSVLKEIEEINQLGIRAIAIFPVIDPSKKDSKGTEATKRDNFISRVLGSIKSKFPEMLVIADVALDPYTDHGHDGILENDEILNDQTLDVLAEQSLVLAEAGADIIAPSDMMDGRIKVIRESLDKSSFHNTIIMSYAAKYASAFYGPFRNAISASNNLGPNKKKSYQMDYNNNNEALKEVSMDIKEGADIILIKPGMPYLDVLNKIKNTFNYPTFSYQVSGEYSMLMKSIEEGYFKKEDIIIETLSCFKRAGADAILTYFALEAAKILRSK